MSYKKNSSKYSTVYRINKQYKRKERGLTYLKELYKKNKDK